MPRPHTHSPPDPAPPHARSAACPLHEGEPPLGDSVACVRYHELFRNAPIGVFQCDGRRRLLSANPQLARLYGYETPRDLMAAMDDVTERLELAHDDLEDALDQIRRHGVLTNYEVRIRRRDDTLRWTYHTISAVRDKAGDVQFYDGFVMDISEKKELEQLREDVARAARHDMKSPLHAILAAASLLEKRLTLEGETREMLDAIREKSRAVLHMVNNSLDLFRMEQGDYDPERVPFDLAALVREVGEELAARFEDKALRLTLRVGSGESGDVEHIQSAETSAGGDNTEGTNGRDDTDTVQAFTIHAERRHIERMLSNLMKNAMEAAPPESEVRVTLERLDDASRITMHNQGAIPEDIRPHLFERYTTSGKKDGLGLGAYSARLTAQAHGGDIRFTTSEAEGTQLIITLPDVPARDATTES